MATPRELMAAARTSLLLDQPFFGVLALRLQMVEDPTCKTAWTDAIDRLHEGSGAGRGEVGREATDLTVRGRLGNTVSEGWDARQILTQNGYRCRTFTGAYLTRLN